jgi:hypothetical protein
MAQNVESKNDAIADGVTQVVDISVDDSVYDPLADMPALVSAPPSPQGDIPLGESGDHAPPDLVHPVDRADLESKNDEIADGVTQVVDISADDSVYDPLADMPALVSAPPSPRGDSPLGEPGDHAPPDWDYPVHGAELEISSLLGALQVHHGWHTHNCVDQIFRATRRADRNRQPQFPSHSLQTDGAPAEFKATVHCLLR